ncbi:hypothetical protein [Actinoalloteichus hymeniacidonis]|uniref:Uncharacterized protein n=1 Tax=Actinoalloteichus hymeniacidonis TaxID=340345 RepID=A0AAC9HX03_9PSEU|nr:hypothetical protein [Actinoalloteichus hymeniacidonis]AOS66020.1 hypothetical protein TL08_26255 [Actinoalloteichus hymeniacidonis]MBB5905878.1 nitric oxide reductase activation protein [Actinoalloteichus hymeniacidonis]
MITTVLTWSGIVLGMTMLVLMALSTALPELAERSSFEDNRARNKQAAKAARQAAKRQEESQRRSAALPSIFEHAFASTAQRH